jgi:hypothetical protein
MLNKLKYKVDVQEDGTIKVLKPIVLSRSLKKLQPGRYVVIMEMENEKLIKMKKFYFSQESELANYLGHSKDELHNAIKTAKDTHFAQKIENGISRYESVEEITDELSMMARIHGFQQWAAYNFDFTLKPYRDEDDRYTGTAGLLAGGETQ